MWSSIPNLIKAFPGKAWKALVAWLNSLRRDLIYHFVCGLVIAAFAALTLKMGGWSIMPVICIAFLKEFIDQWRYGGFDWMDFAATCLGGLLPAIFAML